MIISEIVKVQSVSKKKKKKKKKKNIIEPPREKPNICICENKCADQLRSYREADQRLCFRYMDSGITLLQKPLATGLFRTWPEIRLLVFSRDGSIIIISEVVKVQIRKCLNPYSSEIHRCVMPLS